MEYDYVRISTPKQNIDRQLGNIAKEYLNAYVIREVFTGTRFQGRKEFKTLMKVIKKRDTIIFDSVSRMSRNAEEEFSL